MKHLWRALAGALFFCLLGLPTLAQAGPPIQPDLAIVDASGNPVPPPYVLGQTAFLRVGATNTRTPSTPDAVLSASVTTSATVSAGLTSALASVPIAASKGVNNDLTGVTEAVTLPPPLGPNGSAPNFAFAGGVLTFTPPVVPGGGRVSGLFPVVFLSKWPAAP